jgi:hypothetical protein
MAGSTSRASFRRPVWPCIAPHGPELRRSAILMTPLAGSVSSWARIIS